MAQPCKELSSVFKIHSSFHDIFPRRLLVLGYSSGLQIWDCTNLDSIAEMLNVTSPDWGRVLHAEVLPNPPAAGDEFLNSRPLLGMMCGSRFPFASLVLISRRSAKYQHHGPDFLVYSLSSHKVIKKLSIPGIVSFSANTNVIVIVRCFPSSCSYLSFSVPEHVEPNIASYPFISQFRDSIYYFFCPFYTHTTPIILIAHKS